jgi:hypothetical protein
MRVPTWENITMHVFAVFVSSGEAVNLKKILQNMCLRKELGTRHLHMRWNSPGAMFLFLITECVSLHTLHVVHERCNLLEHLCQQVNKFVPFVKHKKVSKRTHIPVTVLTHSIIASTFKHHMRSCIFVKCQNACLESAL